jgi:hypothetical protein
LSTNRSEKIDRFYGVSFCAWNEPNNLQVLKISKLLYCILVSPSVGFLHVCGMLNQLWFQITLTWIPIRENDLLFHCSCTTNELDIPTGRSSAVIALSIWRFLFTAVSWSKSIKFALPELWIDEISHLFIRIICQRFHKKYWCGNFLV